MMETELLRLQGNDRQFFETIRKLRRKTVPKDRKADFDLLCSNIRKNMRIKHEQIRENFKKHPTLMPQQFYTQELTICNFGLDFFDYKQECEKNSSNKRSGCTTTE